MFGLSMKVDKLGYLEKEFDTLTEHEVRSQAGSLFHAKSVQSVCVFDGGGNVSLYLKKTPEGVHREDNRLT